MSKLHGMRKTSTYASWDNMKQRCQNINHKRFAEWGGRGITVCEDWQTFSGFFADMGVKPAGSQIDRIDNNKGYYKDNCRWVSGSENCRNTRASVFLQLGNLSLTLAEWSERIGIKVGTIWWRKTNGWPLEKALNGGVHV
jgi:hypothetical protein